jgi:hypothetical protein
MYLCLCVYADLVHNSGVVWEVGDVVVEDVAVGGVAVVGGVVVGGGGGGGEGVVRGSGQNALQLLYPVQAVQAVVRQDVVHHLHVEGNS